MKYWYIWVIMFMLSLQSVTATTNNAQDNVTARFIDAYHVELTYTKYTEGQTTITVAQRNLDGIYKSANVFQESLPGTYTQVTMTEGFGTAFVALELGKDFIYPQVQQYLPIIEGK